MYQLQKYKSRATKHECPGCGRRGCFVYYVNEDGVALHPAVGRCDHQSSCGYHVKPRDFFKDHPEINVPDKWKKQAPEEPKKLWTIPKEEVKRFRSNASALVLYLKRIFDPVTVEAVAALYQLGALDTGATVFWQIDKDGRTRTGKVMAYGDDGHRIKTPGYDRVTWIHSLLIRDRILDDKFEITQALFGEHLLRVRPDATVYVVESEKTAVICTICDQTGIYLATGGIYGLTAERLNGCRGRKIIAVPDADAVEEWTKRVESLKRFYDISLGVPPYTEDDIINKRDIADLILKQICTIHSNR